jgi:hypothetical protein
MAAATLTPTSPEINQRIAVFFAKLERALANEFPVCGKCGFQLVRGELVTSEGSEHIDCPVPEGAVLKSRLQELAETEPELEMLRRLR